jgi:hypothetical protein
MAQMKFLKSKIFKSPLLWGALLIIIFVLYFIINKEGMTPNEIDPGILKKLEKFKKKKDKVPDLPSPGGPRRDKDMLKKRKKRREKEKDRRY